MTGQAGADRREEGIEGQGEEGDGDCPFREVRGILLHEACDDGSPEAKS